jgi:hypothetical protein
MSKKILVNTGHRELIEILSKQYKPESYLEVGVRDGATIQALLKGHHPKLITLCDNWSMDNRGARQGHNIIMNLFRDMHYNGNRIWLDGHSQELIDLFRDDSFDIVHIDGEHNYEPARFDVMTGYRLTKNLLIVHDAKFDDVAKAIASAVIMYDNPPTVYTGGTGTAVFNKNDSF